MTYKFTANHIFNEDDSYMIMLGFADDEFEPSQFVIIQKAHEYDDQDMKLGMDKLHIQVEDQSRSQYGGISAINVTGNSLVIKLDDSGKSSLKINGDIEIMVEQNHPNLKSTLFELEKIVKKENILFINKK